MIQKIILALLLFFLSCKQPENLVNEPDGTIKGNIIPGVAAGRTGSIYVVASYTNDPNETDWTKHSVTLSSFDSYKIKELVAGKYYLLIHLDENKNQQRDPGEPSGGYDTDGDNRVDPVTLIGGKTLEVDLRFFTFYE
jgi:hypothetical protein